MAKKFEDVAVERVGARFRCQIDDTAIEPAELRGRAVALDLELLDGIDDRIVRKLSWLGLQHGNAVEEVLVGARSPAVDARQDGIRRQGDTGRDGGKHDEQSTVERQLHDLLVLDHGAETRGRLSHDRRVADYGYLFGRSPSARSKSIRAFSPVAKRTPSRRTGLNPASAISRRVLARRKACRCINAVAGGNHHSLQIRPCFSDGDRGAWNGGPSLVVHHTGDLASRCLSIEPRMGSRSIRW